jgi:hypothetical protein
MTSSKLPATAAESSTETACSERTIRFVSFPAASTIASGKYKYTLRNATAGEYG